MDVSKNLRQGDEFEAIMEKYTGATKTTNLKKRLHNRSLVLNQDASQTTLSKNIKRFYDLSDSKVKSRNNLSPGAEYMGSSFV